VSKLWCSNRRTKITPDWRALLRLHAPKARTCRWLPIQRLSQPLRVHHNAKAPLHTSFTGPGLGLTLAVRLTNRNALLGAMMFLASTLPAIVCRLLRPSLATILSR
jgi:hypothetical protein